METKTFPGVACAEHDAAVLMAIEKAERHRADGPTTVFGLRNRAGCVYRVVYTRGAVHALALVAQFEELGLVNDLCERDKARERCDAVYAPQGGHPSQRGRGLVQSPTATAELVSPCVVHPRHPL